MLVSAVDVWIGAEPLLSVRCLLLDQEMDLLVALQPQVLGPDLLAPWAGPLGLQVDCLIHPDVAAPSGAASLGCTSDSAGTSS